MKNILVLHHSQTGQLTNILDSVLTDLTNDPEIKIHKASINLKKNFSYPWSGSEFMDAFPEAHLEIPFPVESAGLTPGLKYDLIILGWQPWFLSTSIPVSSFLQSEEAKKLFDNTPVLSVCGCRNMWISGFEKLRKRLKSLNSKVVGNIVLRDWNNNLVSVVTVIGWLMYGQKNNFLKIFPRAGVSDKEILNASRFGKTIAAAVKNNELSQLNERLLSQESVKIADDLMQMELRASQLFYKWATFVIKKGKMGDKSRSVRVKAFEIYLYLVIFLVSPLASGIFKITGALFKGTLKKKKDYYLYPI
jgi:hypothetical protein